jgi:hypothetical protein
MAMLEVSEGRRGACEFGRNVDLFISSKGPRQFLAFATVLRLAEGHS